LAIPPAKHQPPNTAIGFNALYSNATADNNNATGAYALVNNTTDRPCIREVLIDIDHPKTVA
jgi:hypothetical protein